MSGAASAILPGRARIGPPPARAGQQRLDRALVGAVAIGGLIFLALPIVIVVPMSFSSANTLTFPPPGVSLRWYLSFFGDPKWLAAGLNSLFIAFISSLAALVLGTLAAYGLVRGHFPGRLLLEGNFVAPLVVPPVVKAVALYIVYAKLGLLGTYIGLIIGHTIIAVAYVIILMSVAIRSFDLRIEQVAESLGASRLYTIRRVVLPSLTPYLVAAWILTFIVSFDEIILTFFLFGNRDTLPKRMFVLLEQKIDPTITAIATMLILVSVLSLAVLYLLMRRAGMLERVEGAE